MKKRDVILNTQAHRPAFNDFAELVEQIARREGWGSAEVFRHWIEAAFRALRGPCLKLSDQAAFDLNEAEYIKIVKTSRHPKETMADFSKMLGATEMALIAEPCDFLGPVFSELAASAEMGQFFTPFSVSLMMAKMTLGDAKSMLGDKPYLAMMEPASGCGGMILASNIALRDEAIDISRQVHWTAIDIDYRCMAGCFIQLELTDASADVYRGNALSSEPPSIATSTSAAYVYPKRRIIETGPPFDKPPPAQAAPADQLSLF